MYNDIYAHTGRVYRAIKAIYRSVISICFPHLCLSLSHRFCFLQNIHKLTKRRDTAWISRGCARLVIVCRTFHRPNLLRIANRVILFYDTRYTTGTINRRKAMQTYLYRWLREDNVGVSPSLLAKFHKLVPMLSRNNLNLNIIDWWFLLFSDEHFNFKNAILQICSD